MLDSVQRVHLATSLEHRKQPAHHDLQILAAEVHLAKVKVVAITVDDEITIVHNNVVDQIRLRHLPTD
jgi:hypothetical protein